MSSPLTVLRFSCWHFSEAAHGRCQLQWRAETGAELTLARDEGDELADAFLHALLCLLCNLGVFGQGHLHDSRDWSKVADVSI
jgi:hypothetical protein